MAVKKRKRGRPVEPDAKRRRRMIGLRLRDETTGWIAAAAAAAGRSLSQEIEHRIERSFTEDRLMVQTVGLNHQLRLAILEALMTVVSLDDPKERKAALERMKRAHVGAENL